VSNSEGIFAHLALLININMLRILIQIMILFKVIQRTKVINVYATIDLVLNRRFLVSCLITMQKSVRQVRSWEEPIKTKRLSMLE